MTANATANRVTMWRALVGVEVMGGEYMTRGSRARVAIEAF
jgi:hypothetical protein